MERERRTYDVTAQERVARYLWWTESGRDAEWSRYIGTYRERARMILSEADGYKRATERIRYRRPEV